MWYELKWEIRVAQREASVWKTWRRRDSHGEATKRQRLVSDRQCGPPTQRVSGHPWGVRAKEGQTWPLSSCRRLAQSGTRNQSWVCLWVHVWTAQGPSWYWFYCSALLKRTYKTQTFSRIAQHHIDWQLMEGAARDHSRVNVLCYCCFVFFFLCEWLTTSCWHQSCRVGEWRPNSYWVTKQMRETPLALINGSSPRPTSQTSTCSATSTGSVPGSRERPPTGRSSNHLVFKTQLFLCNYLPKRGSMMSLYLLR